MSFLGTPEFKVGLLIIVVSILIGVMSMKVSENPAYLGSSKRIHFLVDDASGLIRNSPVRVAGIRVGVIESIVLDRGRARVNMVVRTDVLLSKTSQIQIRANGILGDKTVEIVPGSKNDPMLVEGDKIMVVEDNASMDRLVNEVGKITTSLTDIAENIRDATEGDQAKPLGKIIANLEKLTTDMATLVGHKKDEVGMLIDRMNSIAGSVDQLLNDDSDNGLRSTWKNTMARLDSTMANIDQIASKVNNGEGTIGKLINDEETVEELNTAISSVNGFIQAGQKIETSFDYYGHYMTNGGGLRNYFGIRIQPGLDRFYEAAVVDIPSGIRESSESTLTPDGGVATTTRTDQTFFNRVAISILFGKKFYNLAIKGGIMENTGGVGLEYNFWQDRFKLQFDAFNFQTPQVRGYLRYNFFKGMYVVGGQQFQFQDGSSNPSAFVGAGLFLTNDDIKILLQ